MENRVEKKKESNLTNEASNNIGSFEEILSLVKNDSTELARKQHLERLKQITKNCSDEEQKAIAEGLRVEALAYANAVRLIDLGYDKKKFLALARSMEDI